MIEAIRQIRRHWGSNILASILFWPATRLPTRIIPLWRENTLPISRRDPGAGAPGRRTLLFSICPAASEFPIGRRELANDIFAIGKGVQAAYEKTIAAAGMELSIYTELGRFMTGPHGALIATAIHEKKIYKDYIGLDACAANLMRPAMYGAYHHITV